jgi:hypothetical protein
MGFSVTSTLRVEVGDPLLLRKGQTDEKHPTTIHAQRTMASTKINLELYHTTTIEKTKLDQNKKGICFITPQVAPKIMVGDQLLKLFRTKSLQQYYDPCPKNDFVNGILRNRNWTL